MVRQPDPAQQFADMCLDHILARAVDAQGQRHVVEGREMVEQPEILIDDADAPPDIGQFVARDGGEVPLEDIDQAPGRPMGQIHQFQQGRLARPACPHQEVKGARFQFERDIAQDFGARAIPHADIFEPNHVIPPRIA